MSRYYAFFDVDGTITLINSMRSFLRYFFVSGRKHHKVRGFIRYYLFSVKFYCLRGLGVRRERLNRLYYKCFKNINTSEVNQLSDQWYRTTKGRVPCIFRKSILRQIVQHRKRGARLILVSGGFNACINPIAKELNIHEVLCTELECINDQYTGKLVSPVMIGQGKVAAIEGALKIMTKRDRENAYAFGDHESDIPMLRCVGNPIVVGHNKRLMKYAHQYSWKIIL